MERGSKREVSPPAPEFWACEVSMFRMMPLIVALAFPFSAHAWSATVLDVHDGDTVTVAPMGDVRVPIKLRLYGIDAPELEQKGGPQSRDHLLSLVRPGQGVEVIKMSTDKYGRGGASGPERPRPRRGSGGRNRSSVGNYCLPAEFILP